ncbi:MAG: hypothetical protein ABIU63_01225, partial [Chitinophagaceae bacterium]
VKELIQDQLTPENLRTELNDLLHNPVRIAQLKDDYMQLQNRLHEGGPASANAARSVVKLAKAPQPSDKQSHA